MRVRGKNGSHSNDHKAIPLQTQIIQMGNDPCESAMKRTQTHAIVEEIHADISVSFL